MKNLVNRALAGEQKKVYSQPCIETTVITPSCIICAGSPTDPDLTLGGRSDPGAARMPGKGTVIPY